MRGPWRAALALALHIGFVAVPVGLTVGLLGIAVYTYRYDTGSGLRAGVAALVVALVVALFLRTVLRTRPQPQGVPVDGDAQPQLWRMIREIAEEARTPVPEELRITSVPSALLRTETTLLGLRVRTRRLEVGLPLIAGLTVEELRAVLGREIGMFADGNGLRVPAHRIGTSVAETASGLVGGPTKWLFAGYARLCALLTTPVTHRLELDADDFAVRLVGLPTAPATLRKCVALELGWRSYAEEYLSMAVRVEHTPDLLLGFRAFLEHPEREQSLATRAEETLEEQCREPGTDGPTPAERIERIEQNSDVDRDSDGDTDGESDDRPAMALFRNARRSVPALEDQLLVDDIGTRVPWPEMARLAGAHDAAQQAARLSSAVLQSGVSEDPTLAGVLAVVHQGRAEDLVNPVLNPGLSPERFDEAVIDTLTELLAGAVVDALVRAGQAHHELNWAGPSNVRLANGRLLDPDRLVRPAVVDPRLVPGFHRHLVHLGVPLDHAQPAAEEPEPVLSGIVTPVQCAGTLYELLVTDRGLLLVPARCGSVQRALAGALSRIRRNEQAQLALLADTPVSELRQQAEAEWVDSRDVANARLDQQRSGWNLTVEMYLDDYAVSEISPSLVNRSEGGTGAGDEELAVLHLGSTPDSGERGSPYSGLGRLMGARMHTEEGHPSDE